MRLLLTTAALFALTLGHAARGEGRFTVASMSVTDEKAVFATVESASVEPARARIGGTVAALAVRDGDRVEQGQIVASVGDEKIALQLKSLDSQIAGLEAQLAQAQTDLTRAEDLFARGVIPKTRLDETRTAFNVATNAHRSRIAERSVIQQQLAEGNVLAPISGRVLRVPVRTGTVILPGEPVAMIAEQAFVLRLRVPERHARFLKAGDPVRTDAEELGESGAQFGTIKLVYPQIEDGRVVADAIVTGLGDYFVGQRIRVWVSGGARSAIVIPASYVTTRFGVDYVRISKDGTSIDVPVQRGRDLPRPDMPDGLENLVRSDGQRPAGATLKLGLSGRLTHATIRSPLTPLFLLAALAVGVIALVVIPREEEPQISVPMVDIMVRADGLKAPDAVELVTKPLEAIVKAIDGVEHVYSQTVDDRVMLTARFFVGTKAEDAILRVHEKIRANYDRIPVGIPDPLIVGRGINDVAIVVLTLSAKPEAAERYTDKDLYQIAVELRAELTKVDNVGLSYISGGSPQQIRVEPDPEKLALHGVTLGQLVAKVQGANRSFLAGEVRGAGRTLAVAAGQTLTGVPDIGLLLVSTRDSRPVYVRDVANVVIGPSPLDHRVWTDAKGADGAWTRTPAVSLALAKRAGANAVVVAEQVLSRLDTLKGRLVPADVDVTVTRDYGDTANEKANELLFHLGLATLSIVVLIAFAIGWREAVVTLVVIPTTILLTLFAANLMGYTINRVSLFALIFAIGILVDDAIVIVENIARHWAMQDGRTPLQAAVEAVAEVGNPTVVATLTVVAALLPMLFVSGLMGPYMAPIPANASAAMLFSFFVAVVVAPWLMLRLAPRAEPAGASAGHQVEGRLGRVYRRFASPITRSKRSAWTFLLSVGVATLAACALFATKTVTVKLLPFDNKSELAVVLDLPQGASLEDTERTLFAAAEVARGLPEVTSIQAYAGTPAPFNFNGLVRHYYSRESAELGELQINLAGRSTRNRSSHDVALDLRHRLKGVTLREGAMMKVVEVPPGPPVLATLLAEIYGPDSATRRAVVGELEKIFASVPFIVDVDDSVKQPRPRLRISIDQDRLEFFGVEQRDVYDTIQTLLGGVPVGYSHRGEGRNPIEISVHLPKRDLAWTELLASTPVPANTLPGNRTVVELGDVVHVSQEAGSASIFRRDGRFADLVMADLAGLYEAPIYGMLEVARGVDAHDWGTLPKPLIRLHGQPEDESKPALLWDGEWEITYVTFRDLGAAFGAAIVGIYILVVAQFGSFKLPLVILTPIPLTLIGIVLGHWLFGAPFTATSMIGFIALAGIIVRNSILLVDFIRHRQGQGHSLREVLLEAGAVRFKPILLTALAAMIGAATILLDPIFQGLALSLLFGLASSTLLTVLVIPAIYIVLRGSGPNSNNVNREDAATAGVPPIVSAPVTSV